MLNFETFWLQFYFLFYDIWALWHTRSTITFTSFFFSSSYKWRGGKKPGFYLRGLTQKQPPHFWDGQRRRRVHRRWPVNNFGGAPKRTEPEGGRPCWTTLERGAFLPRRPDSSGTRWPRRPAGRAWRRAAAVWRSVSGRWETSWTMSAGGQPGAEKEKTLMQVLVPNMTAQQKSLRRGTFLDPKFGGRVHRQRMHTKTSGQLWRHWCVPLTQKFTTREIMTWIWFVCVSSNSPILRTMTNEQQSYLRFFQAENVSTQKTTCGDYSHENGSIWPAT